MFSANQLPDLPQIQTRKALLILDLQNDFVKPDGALFVRNTPDFLDQVCGIAQRFRENGEVVWVRTVFEERRPTWDPETGAEVVVLGKPARSAAHDDSNDDSNNPSLTASQDRPSRFSQAPDLQDDPEAFLSLSKKFNGRRCCQRESTGFQFPAPILSAIDYDRDTVLVKSGYSAFQSENLVLSFRTQFITEIFICGSLSNISVHATVLDAVRHGLAVTLVEDCLGFRNFQRHEEAMRRMADIMGVEGITCAELEEAQDWEGAVAGGPDIVHDGVHTPSGIDEDMDILAVKSTFESYSKPGVAIGDELVLDTGDTDEEDLANLLIPTIPRRPRHAMSPAAANSKKQTSRPRMRRRETPSGGTPGSQRATQPPESPPPSATNTATTPPAISPQPPGPSRKQRRQEKETLGPDDSIGEGDSKIIYDLPLASNTFDLLRNEINWQKMYHMSGQVPRLVAVQGEVQPDSSIPIYRHPADENPPLLPFTDTVNMIRSAVEEILGHPLNHVLIQLYRDGQDRISEHSDKTLDIVRGSYICNVSLGAERVMTLRTKASAKASSSTGDASETASKAGETSRQSQRIPMPHNSLFVLGEKSNMRWLHGIRPDKRPASVKSPQELAFNGERISLTFRHIGTFTNPESDKIWGQGACSKTKETAGTIIHGETPETEQMIRAFGNENHMTEFDWDGVYGHGFDVVNFVTAAVSKLLVNKSDEISDLSTRLCLVESGFRYDLSAPEDLPSTIREFLKLDVKADSVDEPTLLGADGTTCVTGIKNILRHVAKEQSPRSTQDPSVSKETLDQHIEAAEDLRRQWTTLHEEGTPESIISHLSSLESSLRGKSYLNGQVFNVDDCALWPVLKDIVTKLGSLDESRFPSLLAYYHKVGKRACVKTVLDEMRST